MTTKRAWHFVNEHDTIRMYAVGDDSGNLASNPNDGVSAGGQDGPFATWTAEKKGEMLYQFKNQKNGKYLRMKKNGDIDVGGQGGPLCPFHIRKSDKGPNFATLESKAHPGKFVAIHKKSVNEGQGGQWCVFKFTFEGPEQFTQKWGFVNNQTVILQNKKRGGNSHLRVDPDNKQDANCEGGKGNLAQWHAEKAGDLQFRFKNANTGKYLRIMGNGDVNVNGGQGAWTLFNVRKKEHGECTLESNQFAGKFIACTPQGKVVSGGGGPFCNFLCTF